MYRHQQVGSEKTLGQNEVPIQRESAAEFVWRAW